MPAAQLPNQSMPSQRPVQRSGVAGFFFDVLETVVISMAILLVVYIFIVQPHQVDGHSMDPTLQDREYLLTSKLSYRFGLPQRGDIVVFHAPQVACPSYGLGNCDFIKRVIAFPGEKIALIDGVFHINDEPLIEDYLPEGTVTESSYLAAGREVVLGEDEFFVAGDNRVHSSDSRVWGPIKRNAIVGRVFFSYWPMETFGPVVRGQ